MFFHSRRVIRSSQGAKERKKILLLQAGLFLVSLILVAGLALWVVRLPRVAVGSLSVQGSVNLAKDIEAYADNEIKKSYWGIFPKANIFLYPQTGIKEGLLNMFPRLESVSVSLGDSHSVSIVVGERESAYLWCEGVHEAYREVAVEDRDEIGEDESEQKNVKKCYSLDSKGIVFEEAVEIPENVRLTLYGKPTGGAFRPQNKKEFPEGFSLLFEEEWSELVAFKDNLNGLGVKVASVIFKEDGDREFFVENGVRIFWNGRQGIDTSLQNLTAAFESGVFEQKDLIQEHSPLKYLDLRFNKKVFYKFK